MASSPFFTIVLAGYQTEPYLQKALDSIANQTFRDFEALCYVEECSDRSLEICTTMSERDPRFKVATGPKSGGVGATRNYGIDHASGKYLVFLDGDDWFIPDMLERLFAEIEKKGEVDVLTFACVKAYQENEELSKPSDLKKVSNFTADDADKIFSGQDMLRRAHRHMTGIFHAYAWLNVCRLAFLREHNLYQRKELMEDFEWTPRLWFFAKKMVYMDNVLYYYRVRPDSLITSTDTKNRIMLAFTEMVFPSLFDFACSESVPEDILCNWSNLWLSVLYWYLFHPITSKNISDKNRLQALNALFSGKGRDHFHQIVQHASFPKRIAAPFILLAEKGILFPAKVFFRSFYYPLVQRKKKS